MPFHRHSAEYEGERTRLELHAADADDVAPITVSVPREDGAAQLVDVRPGVRGFRIERSLEGRRVTELEFSIEPRGGAFRVVLERIRIHSSRAKAGDKSWRNWWARIPCLYGFAYDVARPWGVSYGDGAIDVQVDLVFTARWTDARGETRFAPLAILGWTVLDVPLGGAFHEVHPSSGWLPLVPSTASHAGGGEPRYGRGHFTLSAQVTEQDDFSPQYLEERESLGEYFDSLLSLLPIPGAAPAR